MDDKAGKEIKEALHELHETMELLYRDFLAVADFVLKDPSNFWLRIYVRSFFALVEGTTFCIKQVALSAHRHKPCFTEAELSLLEEVTYILNERGDAKSRPKNLDTLANVKFAFKAVTKAFSSTPEVKIDDRGWQSFQEALKIRHQITHPKTSSLLKISDMDDGKGKKVDTIIEASNWYAIQINALFSTMKSEIEKRYP